MRHCSYSKSSMLLDPRFQPCLRAVRTGCVRSVFLTIRSRAGQSVAHLSALAHKNIVIFLFARPRTSVYNICISVWCISTIWKGSWSLSCPFAGCFIDFCFHPAAGGATDVVAAAWQSGIPQILGATWRGIRSSMQFNAITLHAPRTILVRCGKFRIRVSWRWTTFVLARVCVGIPGKVGDMKSEMDMNENGWHWLTLEWTTLRKRRPYRFRHTSTYLPAHRQLQTRKNELSHRYPAHKGM